MHARPVSKVIGPRRADTPTVLFLKSRKRAAQLHNAIIVASYGKQSKFTSNVYVKRKKITRRSPRSAPRRKKDANPSTAVSATSGSHGPRTPSHILARLAELRPVLPRPSQHDRSIAGPSHDPSSNIAHGHAIRRHSNENLHFSPYGRAYDLAHEQFDIQNHAAMTQNNFITTVFPSDEQTLREQLRALEGAANLPPAPPGSELMIPSFPSSCGCGDNCHCPGCIQHNPGATPTSSAFSSCTSPSTCTTCLDCTILSLPASLPPDTSLSIYDTYQADSIDEWIRQVSSLPHPSPTPPNTAIDMQTSRVDQQSLWDGYLPITEPDAGLGIGYIVEPCRGVPCKCPPDRCECRLKEEGYTCSQDMVVPMGLGDRECYTPQIQSHGQYMFRQDEGLSHKRASENNVVDNMYFAAQSRDFFSADPPRSRSSSTSSASSRSQSSRRRSPQHQPFATTQPLATGCARPPALTREPLVRVRAASSSFYAGPTLHTQSVSAPDLGLAMGMHGSSHSDRNSPLYGDSPVSSRSGVYAMSSPESDGYASVDDGLSSRRHDPRRPWRDTN
ncbi:hypothetical protein H0H81_011133 [Sphagnurus paluster]|uniref:Uncharacterized protein n=1 Tax=Sphagnurus paluster TaxID=117069 RepID=A0A9P7KID8_9AGAR|nr:hypothetical protein H0H81_011133 [Sphagnurus paluster]